MTYEKLTQRVNCGIKYYNKKDYHLAIEEYEQAIEEYKNVLSHNQKAGTPFVFDRNLIAQNLIAFIYIQIGKCYFATCDYDRAITEYNKAIEIDSNYADAYYLRGLAYHAKEDFSLEAMKVYCKALEFVPNNSFIIGCFLESITHEKCNIGSDDKVLLQKSSSGLVCLVGDILCEIAPVDWQKYIQLIREVYNLLERLEQEIEFVDKTKCCYQYVAGNSFINSIGKTRSLWLMPACYQNDPDEGKYIFEYFPILTENNKSNNEDEPREQSKENLAPVIAFIRSFTEREDDLVMWNSSYAGNGAGVSLGVPFSKLAEAANRPGHWNQEGNDELYPDSPVFVPDRSTKGEKGDVKKILMKELYFAKVLYLSPDEETEDGKSYKEYLGTIKRALKNITDNLKSSIDKQHVKNFVHRIFLPIAHLIKSAAYKHEQEWRLLYYTTITEGKEKKYIQRDPLHIETEPILFDKEWFKKTGEKEKILLGPTFGNNPEFELMKIQHLFEYDGIADCVDIKTSEKRFRG